MKHVSPSSLLERHFAAAIAQVAGEAPDTVDGQVRASNDPKFGDFQCNAAMALSKELGLKPRDVAERIVAAVSPRLANIAEPLEIAGPGFINIRLKAAFLAEWLSEIPAPPEEILDFGFWILDCERNANLPSKIQNPESKIALDRVGIALVEKAARVVVDYSSPNVAKQMHVGHLRSTVIGDALARVLTFAGHEVIRQNHIGDWGTSLGMAILGLWYISARQRRGESSGLIEQRIASLVELKKAALDDRRRVLEPICAEWSEDFFHAETNNFADANLSIEQLELGYVFVQTLLSAAAGLDLVALGDELTTIPQKVTKMLQTGGAENEPERRAWQNILRISLDYCAEIYARLGALLRPEDIRGESFYSDRLGTTVIDLQQTLRPRDKSQPAAAPYAEVRTDKGATCIYFYDANHQPLFRAQDGGELPMIIQKSDGAFLYATTDLAAVRFRTQELGATRILYVVGAPTRLHLEMLFTAARLAGWLAPGVTLTHVSFGQVLGEDRKLLRTRTGGAVKLKSLLDEAESRAREELDAKLSQESPEYRDSFDETEKRVIAQRVGIGAIKYFDLARDLSSDYVFNWNTMLAMQGNTAPYLMYAYTRIRSMLRDAAAANGGLDLYAAGTPLRLDAPAERTLALALTRLPAAIGAVARELSPHILCNSLHELAGEFMRFYEACPVLKAPDEPTRRSRLRLCDLTARSVRLGLELLGINVVERM